MCVCVRFALVCCALRVDFIKSLRLTNTVIIIIIIKDCDGLELSAAHLYGKDAQAPVALSRLSLSHC